MRECFENLDWLRMIAMSGVFLPIGIAQLAIRFNRMSMHSVGALFYFTSWIYWIGGTIAVMSLFFWHFGPAALSFFGIMSYVVVTAGKHAKDIDAVWNCYLFCWGMLLTLIAGGMVLYLAGQKKAKSIRAKHYMDLIVNQKHTSVHDIAILLHCPDVPTVVHEIQDMIAGGALKGYVLNPNTLKITNLTPVAPVEPAAIEVWTEAAPLVFVCKACGARNEASGSGPARCEYCDRPHTA